MAHSWEAVDQMLPESVVWPLEYYGQECKQANVSSRGDLPDTFLLHLPQFCCNWFPSMLEQPHCLEGVVSELSQLASSANHHCCSELQIFVDHDWVFGGQDTLCDLH